MRLYRTCASLRRPPSAERRAVTIGVFDGLHIGHRASLERARAAADELAGPSLVLTFAGLSSYTSDNDGMLRVQDQVAPPGQLLGVVNADHLSVGIPYPGNAYVFAFSAMPFPRPQVVLAAVDVIAGREQ